MEESYARWQENKLGRDGQEILEQLDAVWGSPGKDNDGDWLEEDDEEEEDAEEKGGAEEEEGAEEMEEDVEGDEDSEGGEDAEGEEEQEAEVSRLFEKIKSLEHEKEQLLKQKELEEQRSTRKREEDGKGKEEDAEGEEGDGIELEDVPMIEIVEDIDGYKLTRKAYIDVAFRDPPGPWSRDFKLNRKIDRVEELAESPASHASKSPASASHTSDPEPSDGPGSLDMDEAKSP
jgi:TolA-binding protein